jgi:hypothetical protein
VALWDVASQEPIGPLLPDAGHEGEVSVTARFAPDGAHLFVLSNPDWPEKGGALKLGRAIRWEVDPAAWRRQACRLMGGNLTPEEWEEIAPEHDYIELCPSG